LPTDASELLFELEEAGNRVAKIISQPVNAAVLFHPLSSELLAFP